MKQRAFWTMTLVVVAATLGLGCETTSTQEGAVVGGMLGAGTGAIIGHQTGHQGEGALIGAAAGALTGALIGDQVDREPGQAPAVRATRTVQRGHYETRVVTSPSGETYEERVWVHDR